MKNEQRLDSILEMVKGLSEHEQSILADKIMRMMTKPNVSKSNMCNTLIEEVSKEKPDCPHCDAKSSLGFINKKGTHKGAQRYYCKSCGKYFVSTTNTAFAFSRKTANIWRRFISMTISGKSLHQCADECNIAYQTAFTWRHKILNAFAVNQEETVMNGNVEVDEMLIPISYKGNHVQGPFGKREFTSEAVNNMPRKAFQRGSDNKSRSSKEKACVFCMVDSGYKSFYAAVPGVGFMNEAMLDVTVAKHINKETALVLADDYKITKNYFEKNGYKHMILLSNTSDNPKGHKPEIQGENRELHLQHVNAMHHHIRNFLRPYCGVSSKYLSNYISMFIWLKSLGFMKKKKAVEKATVARVATSDCYISHKNLISRPAVPQCA